MDGARLEVAFEPHPDGFGPNGAETVELLVATNPGLPTSPLRDAASGGELSRIMLALIGLGARTGERTLVFDEIDAGIGGFTARAVGERLRASAAERQLICITHLPQVAALAETHFRIEKSHGRRRGPRDRRAGGGRRAGRRDRAHARRRARRRRGQHATPASCSKRPSCAQGRGGPGIISRMALLSRARALLRGPEIQLQTDEVPTVVGRARLGRRTKDLVKRLGPGDIAIIDHADLDRIAAEDLVASGVGAVVNVAESSTGRYPNPGPLVLARAGVPLIDVAGRAAVRGARRRRPAGDRGLPAARQRERPGHAAG